MRELFRRLIVKPAAIALIILPALKVNAGITWISQDRHSNHGLFSQATPSGILAGMHDVSSYVPTAIDPAPGFGPNTTTSGGAQMVSDIDTTANTVTARGAGGLSPTPTIVGIQFISYPFDTVHLETKFNLTDPTPFAVTKNPIDFGSAVKLIGPGAQTLTFPATTGTSTGVLDPGDWTLVVGAGPYAPDPGPPFNFTFQLNVPEPSIGFLSLGILLVRRQRQSSPPSPASPIFIPREPARQGDSFNETTSPATANHGACVIDLLIPGQSKPGC